MPMKLLTDIYVTEPGIDVTLCAPVFVILCTIRLDWGAGEEVSIAVIFKIAAN